MATVKLNGTHQHETDGKVYTYDAEYTTTGDGQISWSAKVRQGGELRDDIGGVLAVPPDSNAPTVVRLHLVTVIDQKDYSFKG